MAVNSASESVAEKTLTDLIQLLWGNEIRDDVFQRWNQGFVFSEDEPSALLQHDGGPCAVIAPVQAFLLKNLLFSTASNENWRQITGPERDRVLVQSMADILQLVSPNLGPIIVVYSAGLLPSPDVVPQEGTASGSQVPDGLGQAKEEAKDVSEMPSISRRISDELGTQDLSSSPKRQRFSHESFHLKLRCINCCKDSKALCVEIQKYLHVFCGDHGVLQFLYSILLTKGLEQVKKEMADLGEALIDPTHGHGSQSLINLLITGNAVPHVWDNEMEVSGLKLQGITCKSNIGFLTLLEHFRYCEVGWNLKNPIYPVWLLGSETHLTILFSQDKTLVGEESTEQFARRMFGGFDKEGRGFITVDSLEPLMKLLNLVSVPEYVKIVAQKLDPEQLGVITLNSFLEEFYSNEKHKQEAVQTFTVYHYNGLPRSSHNNKVQYAEANCAIMEMPEVQMISDFSQIKSCLLTKWPTIELTWKNDLIPSLN